DSTAVRSDLRAITADGAAFSVMVGVGETYLVPFALALGIAAGQASLLATLPVLAGSPPPLPAPRGRRRAAAAPAVLFAVGAAYGGFGMATGRAWNAWVGTIVPARLRARFFARR